MFFIHVNFQSYLEEKQLSRGHFIFRTKFRFFRKFLVMSSYPTIAILFQQLAVLMLPFPFLLIAE